MSENKNLDQNELQVLLARQGIYNKSGAIYAYELLYRNNEQQSNIDNADETAGVKATSSVITQLFTNFDIDSVIGNKLAFINFTYTDIIQQIPRLLPKNRIVIEVLETVTADKQLISNLLAFRKEGYQIALDDFVYKDELIPLIEIADIIKLDVLHQTKETITEQMNRLKGYQGKLLAEKISDKKQFTSCVNLGFDYFQGFFLNKPDALKGQVITDNTSLILKALTELNDEEISGKELERSILHIPKLSYLILRVANSAYYYSGTQSLSLTEAILRIGLLKVRNWANLILLASNPETSLDLIERTLIRAHMCESIAKNINYVNPNDAYTVGMFSTLDGMLNEPLPSLLSKVTLSQTLNQALIHHEGDLGKILKCVIDYEQADFHALENFPFDRNNLIRFYLQGIKYANTTLGIIN